mgnify:CR=1 FL=1
MMEKKSKWHGWSRAQDGYMDAVKRRHSLLIGPLPGRKQIVLYVLNEERALLTPLAYFKTEALAEQALTELDILLG